MKVVITAPAKKNLQQLYYFYSKVYSEQKAKKIRTSIFSTAKSLKDFAKKGQKEELLSELGLDHRYLVQGHCKIIYRVDNDTVYTTDFFDTRQEPSNLITRNK